MNSFTFRNVSEALPALCKEVLTNGDEVGSRNGRTMELPFTHITLTHPWERYITVTGRKASLPAQCAETMWILAGRNDIEWLSHYLPRSAEFSDDGKTWRGGYGPRLRGWPADEYNGPAYADAPIDQLKFVVDLLKKEPLSRRAVMSIYNPAIDSYEGGKDKPCNTFIQFMSRLGKLDMHIFIRSNDLIWGFSGVNAFVWSALQEIVAGLLGIQIGQLHFSISSLHLYDRHWKKAEELSRAEVLDMPHDPQFKPYEKSIKELDRSVAEWFHVEKIIREKGSEAARTYIEFFREPMLKDWLVVIAKYHDSNFHWPGRPNWSDAMITAWQSSPKKSSTPPQKEEPTPFVTYVDNLHREKHKAYGDSWCRRGEMLGIMANIARKIDRLGHDGGGDTATDTAIDLLVYLTLYRWWLVENADSEVPLNIAHIDGEDEQVFATLKIMHLQSAHHTGTQRTIAQLEQDLRDKFDRLEVLVEEKRADREYLVEEMMTKAYQLASHLWWKDQNATRAFTGYPS